MTRGRWWMAAAALGVVAIVVVGAVLWLGDRDSDGESDGDSAIAWGACTFEDDPAFADDEGDPELRDSVVEGLEEAFADSQCALVDVPVDYENPDRGRLELFVSRRPAIAPDPLGPLFVNQGGPGVEGVRYSSGFLSDSTFDRFDVIGMDPRGTGRSTHVDCGSATLELEDDDAVLPAADEPTTPVEASAEAFAAACAADPNLAYFGSNNAARDMDRLRELLGADQITYNGKSYGSDLGTAYVSLFPERVRAAVFDGASDLTLDPVDFVIQQGVAGDERIERYFEHCRAEGCAWAGGDDPADAWAALVAGLRTEPMIDPETGTALSGGMLVDWGHEAYVTSDADMDEALDGLVIEGDAGELLEDEGDIGDLAPGFFGVTCLDLPVDDYRAAATRLAAQVPDPPSDLLETLAVCSAWPVSDPIAVSDAAGSGPILVTATTGDVPTPFVSSVGLAAALEPAVVVEYDAQSHTAYFASPCVKAIVDAFLVDLEVPSPGKRCDDSVADLGDDPDDPDLSDPPDAGVDDDE